ncbi:SCAN domain-containing protein 3-like [Paramisgurnus dabryanus]|uniref:SCAN domain-containing protein 3-like n=1 Tax=Paramisgurnus dabryanus TaxID=90735 RepID=UPI003CCF288E
MPADERAGSADNAEGREEDDLPALPSTSGRAARQTRAPQTDHPSSKARKYREEYITYGFTCIVLNQVQHPQCVVCSEVLAHESLKPVKMLRHLKTKHPSLADKPTDFFRRKEKELHGQKKVLIKQTTIPAKAQRASFEVSYLIAQTKKPHTIGETLIKPAAIVMSRIMHGDKLAAELEQVPLSDGTVSRRITEMAQDIKCQLIDRVKKKHKGLLLHTEVRWLSRGNVLRRLYELRDETTDQRSPLAEHLSNPDWVTRLAYLSCIFEKLNGLNLSLQGENTNILYLNDKVQAFARKLVRWRERVEMGRIDMFSELEEFMEENALSVNSIKGSIAAHLQSLLDHFLKYFPEGDVPDQYDWIRSPFNVTTANHLDMEDALIELTTDRTLRTAFNGKTLDKFWVSVVLEYPQLSKAALDVLMQFGSTYLCEKTFSALTYIKNKHRSRLNVEDDLRVAISKIKPRVDLLCSAHSAHPSH